MMERRSVQSLPDRILKLDIPGFEPKMDKSKQPYLCYIKLPKNVSNYKATTANGQTVMNLFDFIQSRNCLYNVRHAENIDFDLFLTKHFTEHNFAPPSNHPVTPTLKFHAIAATMNLFSVIKSLHTPDTYFLESMPDTNSSPKDLLSYFHFSMTGGEKGKVYTLNFCNIPEDLVKLGFKGFQPSIHSLKASRKYKKSWERIKGTIKFLKNSEYEVQISPNLASRIRICSPISRLLDFELSIRVEAQ